VSEEYLNLPDDVAYVMIVADGMGGAACGGLASSLAIRTVWNLTTRVTKWVMRMNDEEPPEVRERVDAFAQMINRALREKAKSDPQLAGMGTTLTAAYTMGADAVLAHVGDSRAYLYRKGRLTQLTRDHTLAQEMVDAGADVDDTVGYRHVLTNCLGGGNDDVSADVTFLSLEDEDGLLICSDGLNLHVSDDEICRTLAEHDVPQAACDALVQMALDRGGKDNVTVVLARYTILQAGPATEQTTATFK
jgi:protein phosphatase